MKKQKNKIRTTAAKNKDKKISCQIPQSLNSKIEEVSKNHNCDKSVIVRMALYSFFNTQD